MNYLDILDKIEQTSGTNNIVSILREHKDNQELLTILEATLSFFMKYGVKEFIVPDPSPTGQLGIEAFKGLLADLMWRKVTGQAAGAAIYNALAQANQQEQKWFTRVLKKDLRIGVSTGITSKAGIAIPEFDVMLAKDGKINKNIEKMVANGVWVSRKYDGYRCIAEVEDFKVRLLSRNGKEYTNFPSIVEAVETFAHTMDWPNFVLDGEIMSNDFQSMQRSAFASTRGTTVGDVKYHVFDMITWSEWDAQTFIMKCKRRYEVLHNCFNTVTQFRVDMNLPVLPLVEVEHLWVNSMTKVLELERLYISEGYEGAMAIPDIAYYLGRKTNAMVKFKTMLSMDCKVLDRYEGEGRNSRSLGGLTVVQENGEICDLGTGFNDQDRSYLWSMPIEDLKGRICEVKYQDLSKDGIMRFPVFIRWRDNGPNKGKI